MATSKQTYECYVCKRNNFPDVRVYLDGKDEQGRTIYKNPDMTPHVHKLQQQPEQHQVRIQMPQQQGQASTTMVTQSSKEDRVLNLLGDLSIKMNRVIKILEGNK